MPWVFQFVRGGALAALFGVGVMAVALITNIASGASLFLYPLAAVTAVLYGLIPDRHTTPQLLGSIVFGVMVLVFGLVTGLGVLEVSGVAGSIVGAVAISVGSPMKAGITLPFIGVAVLLIAIANLIPLVLDGGGLNHDESAYALKARHWVEGTPESGWSPHRGVAMSGYGYLAFQAGGDEAALRLLGLAAIVGFGAATWLLADKVGGRWVGPLSAIALVSSPALLRRSTEYLSDVPSSALLVAAMIVIWSQFGEQDRPGYALLWLLPFAWAAFYIRYQSVLSFVLIAATIAVLFWEKVKSGWRPIALTALLGFVGLVPHFVFATSQTGSPLGILLFTADVAGRDFFGQGIIDYFLLMGWPLAAFVGPVAAVFFIWWLKAGWESHDQRTRCLFLMMPAVGQVLILGVLSHGEARFIFFPLSLTLIGGITGFLFVRAHWRSDAARAVTLGLSILLLGSFAVATSYVRGAVENRARGTEIIELAAEEIREASADGSCGVMTSYSPQITYYSTCFTQFFRAHLEAEESIDRLDGEERFLLLIDDGKRQPTGEELEELIELTEQRALDIEAGGETAEIYQFAP